MNIHSIHAAESAIFEVTPGIVAKHRSAGTLTWKLIHQIEDEVLREVSRSGKHSSQLLRMLKSSPAMKYPTGETRADFSAAGLVPVVFDAIATSWEQVN